jgi:hypothetical protein
LRPSADGSGFGRSEREDVEGPYLGEVEGAIKDSQLDDGPSRRGSPVRCPSGARPIDDGGDVHPGDRLDLAANCTRSRWFGRAKSQCQQFYAILVDRRIQHPAVVAIIKAARQELF